MRREVESLRPPYCTGTISCLAAIMGKTGGLGRSLGLDGRAKLAVFSRYHERFSRQSRKPLPELQSGLIMGTILAIYSLYSKW